MQYSHLERPRSVIKGVGDLCQRSRFITVTASRSRRLTLSSCPASPTLCLLIGIGTAEEAKGIPRAKDAARNHASPWLLGTQVPPAPQDDGGTGDKTKPLCPLIGRPAALIARPVATILPPRDVGEGLCQERRARAIGAAIMSIRWSSRHMISSRS